MGGKSSAPAAPNYTPIAAADQQAAQLQYQLGQEQLQQAASEYAQNNATAQQVISADISTQNQQDASAANAQNFYDSTYKPIEAQFAQQAQNYDTPEREAQQAGMAGEAVDASYDGQRAQAAARLASMGIDPSQARAGALDSQMSTVQATARAGAENMSRLNTMQTGLGLKDTAINIGRGYSSAVANTFNSGTGAGNSAVGANTSTTNANSGAVGTANGFFSGGNNANSAAAGALTQGYNAQLNQFNANQNTSSGIGSALGLIGGIAANAFLAEGGYIDPSMSPSGGQQVDDIPARVNAGEFVMPKDVVAHEGVRKMQSIVDNVRKRMGLPTGGAPGNQQGSGANDDLPAGSIPLPAGASAGRAPATAGPDNAPLGTITQPSRMGIPMNRGRRSSPMGNMQSVGLPI